MKKIGFIGVGIMGKSMVRNLMKAGFEVSIYARTKAKVEDVLQEGALWCNSIGSCAAGKDAVITIVGFPKDVEEVYFAEGNILDSSAAGTYLIDMTTTSPQLAIRIYEKAKKNGQHALDAPVTGGDTGAKNGTLSILAGGEEQDFHVCMPLFEAMGKTIVYEGSAGCGQHTKMANQIMIAGALSGVCEAFAYAQKAGLDMDKLYASVKDGAAASFQLSSLGAKILKDDYAPGFFLKHFIKDMKIAAQEAKDRDVNLEVLNTVLEMYETLEDKGMGDLGTQGLMKYYEES